MVASPSLVGTLLAPHRERSVQRIRGQRTVLAIRDGTDLSFSMRPGCDAAEVVATNQTGAKSLGLSMHATLAVSETGLPLGVLDLSFDAVLTRRRTRRWLDWFTDVARAAREVTGRTRFTSISVTGSVTGKRTAMSCSITSAATRARTCWCVRSCYVNMWLLGGASRPLRPTAE